MTPLSKSDACQSQAESQPEKLSTPGPPHLETARLLLRAAHPADDAALFDYARDPEVARFTTWEPHTCLTDAQQFLARVLDDYRIGKIGYWAIEHQNGGKLIGAVGLTGNIVSAESPPRFEDARAELAYVLARPYWNQGLMTEAAREILQFGFARWNLNRIEARCLVENEASARVMEKLGMKFEGTLRQQIHIKGAFRNLKIYAILKSDRHRLNS